MGVVRQLWLAAIWVAIAMLLAAGTVYAAPFVVSGPLDARATHCGWALDSGERSDSPVAASGADKICKLDLAGLAAGPHTITATAVAVDTIWGRLESAASAPFAFDVPTTPSAPSGLRLVP